jgi:hypothetical protein
VSKLLQLRFAPSVVWSPSSRELLVKTQPRAQNRCASLGASRPAAAGRSFCGTASDRPAHDWTSACLTRLLPLLRQAPPGPNAPQATAWCQDARLGERPLAWPASSARVLGEQRWCAIADHADRYRTASRAPDSAARRIASHTSAAR